MKVCPKHGKKFFSDKFCDDCGEKLNKFDDPRCECGSKSLSGKKFCADCGRRLSK